jgi:hypothetical protein
VKQIDDIFVPIVVQFPTPFGDVYLVGFLGMFGASLNYFRALERLDLANEAQVHNSINAALHD